MIGVKIRSRGRSGRIQRAPTHWGWSGRWHLWSGGDGHRDLAPLSGGPSRQPFANCLPSDNKGKTPASSLSAPTSDPEGGVPRFEWVFCPQTFGPRSLYPTSFASPFDVRSMSSSLALVP